MGKSQTPDFSFEGSSELKANWKHIDKNDYRPFDEDESYDPIFATMRNLAIEQIQTDAKCPKIRDDYLELNDICLKLLGIRTLNKIRVIGACSKARWMAKALFIGKMYLFRHQLDLDDNLIIKLRRASIFICCLYTRFWNRASDVFNAPKNDLCFMQQLQLYKDYDRDVAEAAIRALNDHLWYLGGELIVLSLFSNDVTTETKNKMRRRFQANVADRDERSLRFMVEESTTTRFSDLALEDFVRPRSSFLFQLLQISPDFLQQDAATWEYAPSYKNIKNTIEKSIVVVNDGAERLLGIADKSITSQRARKEKYFNGLVCTKFDKNARTRK